MIIHNKFSEMRAAIALMATKNKTATHAFNYEVSPVPKKGWYYIANRFVLAEFFDKYSLWGVETYEAFSKNLQVNKIGIIQPFFVHFTP